MPKIKIDSKKCIGCGTCVSLCPEVFKLDKNGKSAVIKENGKCNFQEVIDSCPAKSISLEE